MRKLIGLVVILTLAYAGYWVWGSRRIEAGAQQILAQAEQDGWGSAKSVSMSGFPSRFDLTFDAPELRARDGLWSWKAPFAQVFALGYAPNEVIAYAPTGQTLRVGTQDYTLNVDDSRASITVSYAFAMPLEKAIAVLSAPRLVAKSGDAPTLAAKQVRLAIAREDKAQGALPDPAAKNTLVMPGATYRLGAEVVNLSLPPHVAKALAPKAGLPPEIADIHFDALAGFRNRIDRASLGQTPPELMTLSVTDLSLSWGGNDLSVAGDLRVDASGYPEGTLQIRSASWRNWIDVAQGLGMIGRDEVNVLTGIGAMMAAQDPKGAIEVPLLFKNGMMSLGPIPLGAAPLLVPPRS